MLCKYRADEPGSFHHVICRAVEGRHIFAEDRDRADRLKRLYKLVDEGCFRIHAWVIMSNHFHLLLERLETELSRSIQRLLTGFAMRYNKLHERRGHLFQGRFRSIRIERESYLLELLRYIHLNPLRAGIVSNLKELEDYVPSGHLHIIGKMNYPWQSIDLIKAYFSEEASSYSWVDRYIDYLGSDDEKYRLEFEEGSFFINRQGLQKSDIEVGEGVSEKTTRILGNRDFATELYGNIRNKRKITVRERLEEHETLLDLLETASSATGVSQKAIRNSGGSRRTNRIRRVLARIIVNEIGLSISDAARFLRVSPGMISKYLAGETTPSMLIVENLIKRSEK